MKAAYLIAAVSQLALASTANAQTATSQPPAEAPAAQTAGDASETDAQASDRASGGDILVTARRREERIQDVPVSITAVSGEALVERGVTDAFGLQSQTPSLSVTANGASRTSVAYAIRGQRTQEAQLLTDQPVGAYYAEVVAPRPYGFGSNFYDIQSVQVLKGVQGTLFGRNMTGGAVLVEPNHPDLSDYHAEVTGQYGNYDLKDVTGMVNIPVVKDVFALRVAGKYRDRTGFTRDVSTGRDYDDQHYYAFRVSGELKLGRLRNFLTFDYLKQDEHGTGLKLIGYNLVDPRNGQPTVIAQQIGASPFFPLAAGAPPQDLVANFNRALALGRYRIDTGGVGTNPTIDGAAGIPYNRIKNYGIINKTTFDAGPVTFKNIFGYRKIDYVNHTDYDGSPNALIFPIQFSNTENYSEEFQMQGTPFGDAFQLTTGGYFFLEKGTDGAFANTFPQLTSIGYASGFPALAGVFLTQNADAFNQSQIGEGLARSYAFYLSGTYNLTDQFKVSGGVRYNNDLRRATVGPSVPNLVIPGFGTGFCVFNGFGAVPLNDCSFTRRLKNEAVTWDATLQYQTDSDLNLYVSARRGYRAGGFNLRAQSDVAFRPFQPETVQEYEAGIKNSFDLGVGKLTTNLAAFFQDYKNVQRQQNIVVGAQIATIVSNIGVQHNYGGEFEANLNFDNGLSLNLFYSYVDIKVIEGDNGTIALNSIPKHQVGGGITYNRDIDGVGDLNANVNATYRSDTPLDDFDLGAVQPGYALANARVGVSRIGGSNFGVAVFANNIFNTYYMQGGLYLASGGPAVGGVPPSGGPGFSASTFGEPRTYGIELSAKF
ncbi:TonB-dependent receptor [Sphingomonas yantingensis]|uniref:Iron complex outermembrane receptor protein n=1 Tax=Sphingomonas yantingensis TaxID=1241761 RepID=A0A7W9AQL4_9SPHN|nr:TonB-dependent receptor [Sphingomonas yantingensis]MBB5698631.1 iron complex outermembrane receptor protein [Sphingomonas yantingensis]